MSSPSNVYWLMLPLVVVISLVYTASRYESWRVIWTRSIRLCLWILAALVGTSAILLLINSPS